MSPEPGCHQGHPQEEQEIVHLWDWRPSKPWDSTLAWPQIEGPCPEGLSCVGRGLGAPEVLAALGMISVQPLSKQHVFVGFVVFVVFVVFAVFVVFVPGAGGSCADVCGGLCDVPRVVHAGFSGGFSSSLGRSTEEGAAPRRCWQVVGTDLSVAVAAGTPDLGRNPSLLATVHRPSLGATAQLLGTLCTGTIEKYLL